MLCCYQAIRTLISHAASDAGHRSQPGSPSPAPATPSAAASATPDAFPPDRLGDLAADLAFEITFKRNLVPGRPGRRYERKTKRPGGRYKTRQARPDRPADPAHQDRFLADARSPLNLTPLGNGPT